MDATTISALRAYVRKRLDIGGQRWGRGFAGSTARYGVVGSAPTITFGGNASSVDNNFVNGNTRYNAANTTFTKNGSIFVAGTAAGGYSVFTPSHITAADGSKGGGNAPIRYKFMTDATAIDFCFFDSLYGQFNILVDGQYVARDKTAVFGNTGQYRYIKLDFGSDVVTYAKAQTSTTISSGGTGHAIGDVITFGDASNGATGTPLSMKVAQLSGSVVTGVDIVSKGAYTTQPSGTFTQVSSTGSGTGLVIGANFFHLDHGTRRIRTIELIYSSPAVFMGIVIGVTDAFLPAPVTSDSPKVAFIGDSITNGTYIQYGGSHIGYTIAQKLGWAEKCIISGIGGSGWITGGPANTPWSHANRVADYIAYDADVYVFTGSQNDGAASTPLETAVTSVLNQLLAARPNAYVVGIGNILGDSTTLANSIGNGYAAVDAAYRSRVTYLNNHTPNKWIPSGATAAWTVTGDANHLNQSGQDRFGEIAAPQIAAALLTMMK